MELPAEEIVHELGELERCCPKCGLPFDDFPGTEDSEEIDWEVWIIRRVHKRKRYRRACKRPGVSGIITAPVPPKLIPKGKFSTEFWVRILEQKYLFQIPLHRTLKMRDWAAAWVERIDSLFHCNAKRLEARPKPEAFGEQDQILRDQMDEMARVRDEQLAGEGLHPAARKALESLKRHWDGLDIFVENPDIPMDNNKSERGLRNPVVGRKNYYGSGSVWSGMFSAMMFTVFQTLLLNNVNVHQFLMAYFEACARNKGSPPENLDEFLPWRFDAKHKNAA